MTPTGELQRALRKSAHLSNKKKNNKKNKQKKKEYALDRLRPGDVIEYCRFYGPDIMPWHETDAQIRYGIVIEVINRKKKWIRKYKILTEHGLWETFHKTLEVDYRITKVN